MAWPFGGKSNSDTLLRRVTAAIATFDHEKQVIEQAKTSQLRRQVEIWSVSTAQSTGGMDGEYRSAAEGVSLAAHQLVCLDEHLRKLRLAEFHLKNGKSEGVEELLSVSNPCANVRLPTAVTASSS
jgi:hypothetical protein